MCIHFAKRHFLDSFDSKKNKLKIGNFMFRAKNTTL